MTVRTLKEKTLEKQMRTQPKEVKFCKKCVVSNQRPRIVFDQEGVCSACRFAEEKKNVIDWTAREDKLKACLDKHRRSDGRWDVVVPGSGGKDSSFVAHQLKQKYGMHPLTVTWAPHKYTDIGFQNFKSFIDSGFTNILAHGNGKLHRKIARIGLEEIGDPFLPFVYGQACFAMHIAIKFDIKLIFFGENGEAEYGGDPKNNYRQELPLEDLVRAYWKGCAVDDVVDYASENTDYFNKKDFDESDLTFYRLPPVEDLKKADIKIDWYSFYHKWVPQENYYYATDHTGFKTNAEHSEGTYSKYASLDDKLDGLHYYFSYLKFGIGRATSDAAHEVRDGHITREEAVKLVHRYDGEFPKKNFKEMLEYLDVTEERFWDVADSFRPEHLWEKVDGAWKLKHKVS